MRDLKVRQVNPRTLNAARYNPRRITPRELEKLRRSIREYGFVEPVLVRRADKTIIGGHQRVKAAILEGKKSIPAIFLDITKDRANALNLALNRIRGDWDTPKLKALLKDLADLDVDLELTGFDPGEIEQLTKEGEAAIEEMNLMPPPDVVWVLCGIPIKRWGEAQPAIAQLENISEITVQSSRNE